MVQKVVDYTARTGRRIAIAIAGGVVLLGGLVMIILPGPAFLAIPAGLGILALEFEWAQRWLDSVQEKTASAFARIRGELRNSPGGDASER